MNRLLTSPWLAALLTGFLLVLLYPPFGHAILAPFAIAPLCYAVGREYRPKHRFLLGYVSGLILWAGVCWWIAPVLAVHGGMGDLAGWATFALFCILKSVHYGLFALLAGVLIRHWFGPPAIALLWAVLERTQEPITLFGWLMLGDAAIDMTLPLRVVPFAGVYGASFLFALIGACFGSALLQQPRQWVAWGGLTLLPILLPPLPSGLPADAHAAVIQPNLDPEAEWTPAYLGAMKVDLAMQSMKALREGKVDVVLWPETPGPIFYEEDPELRVRIGEIAQHAEAPVILGTIFRDGKGEPRNSAQIVVESEKPAIRYDKMYLVPFGEYVPRLFSWVNQVSGQVGAYTPGEKMVLMPVDGHNAGTFICYESAVGHHVREFARAGAEVFFNLSNDGYFFRTPARQQHLQLVRMRAAENRRWVIRATNDGITVAIDPAGKIRDQIAPFQATGARFGYGYIRDITVFSAYGDWFFWFGSIVVIVCLVASQRPHYRPPPKGTRKVRPTA